MELLKHPLFISIISVLIGTGLLGYFNYLRTRKDAIRDRALEFIDEMAKTLNEPISILYQYIRSDSNKRFQSRDALNSLLVDCFKKRFSTKVKGEALLSDQSFCIKYDCIIHDLGKTIQLLEYATNKCDINNISEEIREHLQNNEAFWNIKFVKNKEELPAPYDWIITLHDYTYHRASKMLIDPTRKLFAKNSWIRGILKIQVRNGN